MQHNGIDIHLVTNTTGFPNGTAAAKRIRMVGKALIAAGFRFSVYTGTLKDNRLNERSEGVIDDIHYKYLHGTTLLKIGPFRKLVLYVKSIIVLNRRLHAMHPAKNIVYIYSQGNIYNLIVLLLCTFYAIKTVEEINEWDYDEIKGPFRKMIFRGPMVKWANGAIVISRSIYDNVQRINPRLKILTIPVLDDPANYQSKSRAETATKYCFWMGQVDGYIDDVLFIIESCGLAYQNGCDINLVISGPCNSSLEKIKIKARLVSFPEDKIKMVGYVDEIQLHSLCRNALFYIVPLWENQKSANRFPTKLAPFMFCGKPVLTCNIGEIGYLLSDNENAIFYKPGDSKDLAQKIELIYNDTGLYKKVCINSKQFAMDNFGYVKYIYPLYNFFYSLLEAKAGVYVENQPAGSQL